MEETALVDAPPDGMVAVDMLDPSPKNRRSADDKEKLESLIASIADMGLLIPIKARPMPNGRLEIVYGERRWRAFMALGLAHIPCTVQELTDAEAHAERITENLVRQDLTPLEEGEGVLAYLELNGCDYGEAAARFGQTQTWLRRRAKLPNLIPEWREAFKQEGYARIGESVEKVEELAIMPAETQKAILDDGVLMYVRTTADMRKKIASWCRNLDFKPWTRKWEKEKVSSAKRCDACLKRSDKEKTLFAGLHETLENEKARLCLDPTCWEQRVASFCKDLLVETPGAIPLWDGYLSPKVEKFAKEHFDVKLLNGWEWDEVDPEEEPVEGRKQVPAVFIGGPRAGTVVQVWIDDGKDDEQRDAELQERREQQQNEIQRNQLRRESCERKASVLFPQRFDYLKQHWQADDLTILASLVNWAAWFGIEPAEYHDFEEDEPELDFLNLAQKDNPVLEYVWDQVRSSLIRTATRWMYHDAENRPDGNDLVILNTVCGHLNIDLQAMADAPEVESAEAATA